MEKISILQELFHSVETTTFLVIHLEGIGMSVK